MSDDKIKNIVIDYKKRSPNSLHPQLVIAVETEHGDRRVVFEEDLRHDYLLLSKDVSDLSKLMVYIERQ